MTTYNAQYNATIFNSIGCILNLSNYNKRYSCFKNNQHLCWISETIIKSKSSKNTYLNIIKIFNKFKKNWHHWNAKFGSYIDLEKKVNFNFEKKYNKSCSAAMPQHVPHFCLLHFFVWSHFASLFMQ